MLSILLVDDALEDRELISELVEKANTGVEVIAVSDGPSAVQVVTAKAFDCALVDYYLDGEEGLSVLADVLKLQPDLPVVMLTGQISGSAVSSAIQSGATRCLSKTGMSSKRLWSTIEKAIALKSALLLDR